MSPRPIKSHLTLLITDRGAQVLDAEGKLLGQLPEAPEGPERRLAWAAALRCLAAPGSPVQVLLAHSNLETRCQEAPYLSPRERREVAGRMASAQRPAGDLVYAATLDSDPHADGGHVLWVAMLPHQEMHDWCGAIAEARLSFVYATPFHRALLQGLEATDSMPPDRIVLALGLEQTAHLLIFHGRSLQIVRSFHVPDEQEEADELLFGEVNRLLQFFKQKNRHVSFETLLVVGTSGLSTPFQNRLRSTLKLSATLLAPELWTVMERGLRVERARSDGLNLVPLEVQEVLRRRFFKGVVWLSAAAMVALLGLASLLLGRQEKEMELQTLGMEATLAQRLGQSAEDKATIQARLPLLRVRMAEGRQTEARRAVARIGAVLFQVPEGIQLEKVEITETAGALPGHRFVVSGLVFTGNVFSVGPLAQYLQTLSQESGFKLSPLQEIQVSDRVDEKQGQLDQRAVSRFTLEGTAP